MLFIGQLWANIAPYCFFLTDNKELIELCAAEDVETEKEDNKKEKDDKVDMDLFSKKSNGAAQNLYHLYSIDLLSFHHPEITTPPPQLSLFFS